MRLFLTLLLLVASFQAQSKIYDSFICYTRQDMAVIHGVVGDLPQLSQIQIHYHRLQQNPTTLSANVLDFDRVEKSLYVTSKAPSGKQFLELDMKAGEAHLTMDLSEFPGAQQTYFKEVIADCFFGYVEN